MERAPRWGGFWERMVRSVKRSSLKFEELLTLIVEIEATLNNRPLTYVYDDEGGVSYSLTPADLTYGSQIAVSACQRHYSVISTFKSLTRRAKYHFKLL